MGYLILTIVFLVALGGRDVHETATVYFLGGLVKGIGKVAQVAAPIVGMVPGVGAPLAAGIGVAGGLLSGGGLKGALKGAAGGALGGLSGKLFGAVSGLGGAAGGAAGGGGGGLGGLIKGVGGFLGKNAPTILGGIGAIQNARDRTRQQDIINRQLGQNDAALARRRMLEERVIQGIGQQPDRPDLSSIFADPSNPFAR